jgi:hypothetical protein
MKNPALGGVVYGGDVIVYLVNDHDCGSCGKILGVFDSALKAYALIARYRAADDADGWPDDLEWTSTASDLAVEEWEVG